MTAKTAAKPAKTDTAADEPADIVFAGVTFTPDDAAATPLGAALAAEMAAAGEQE